MTNKTTSAIDLVERVDVAIYALRKGPNFDQWNSAIHEAREAARAAIEVQSDTITRLQAALDELKHDVGRQMAIANSECNRAELLFEALCRMCAAYREIDGLYSINGCQREHYDFAQKAINADALRSSVGGE